MALIKKNDTIDSKKVIYNTLVGHKLEYYDIAGNERYYNISEKDIRDIRKSELDAKTVWVVRIGEGMEWDIYLDETGKSIIRIEQLFVT